MNMLMGSDGCMVRSVMVRETEKSEESSNDEVEQQGWW